VLGVVLTFALVAALHWRSDGLWFQGDAPRHAMNGFFWWDFATTLRSNPLDYAIRYYARYPVIAPATYPPLFYFLEGFAFASWGPSPYAARVVVLLFAILAGLYTMAWARGWIGPGAGWTGAFLACIPGVVLWSNTIMLNIPAVALGIASMFHFRRWLEASHSKQLVLAASFLIAALLTYYPGSIIMCVLAAWAILWIRDLRLLRAMLWIGGAGLLASVPLLIALSIVPVHTSRQLPTMTLLSNPITWTFYWKAIPNLIGRPTLILGIVGSALGLATSRLRTEIAFLATWIVVLTLCLSVLPARDPRYILQAAPAFLLAAAVGIASGVRLLPTLPVTPQLAMLMAGLVGGVWSTTGTPVPQVSGFREVARYLRDQAPFDAILYDGAYDGLFGFHVRALDPNFERRIVLANQLIYSFGPTTTFALSEIANVASTNDVMNVLRARCGCHWVAVEVGPGNGGALGQRLLRETTKRPEFVLVRSFAISGSGIRRVDLYRLVTAVDPVITVDLRFPSLTNRAFPHIVPITR